MGEIDAAIRRLSKTINDARWSTNPRVLLELAIVAISSGEGNYSAPGTGQQIRRMPQSTESQSAAAAKIADVQPDTAKSRAEDKEKPASVTQTYQNTTPQHTNRQTGMAEPGSRPKTPA